MARRQRGPGARAQVPASQQVRPVWLLSALALLVVGALGCAYLSLCLLFLQGQWQLLYHPALGVTATPSSIGLSFESERFDPDDAGKPQLTGWWLPGNPAMRLGASPSRCTILYLHGGDGSLSDTLPALAGLHGLGCSVFVFDYRGFGSSVPGHPSEAKMVEDGRAAMDYLLDTRHVPATSLVVWGRGMGATIAAEAEAVTPARPGAPLILEDINVSARQLLLADPRTRFLPIWLLLREHLDASPLLGSSQGAKLFLCEKQGQADATAQMYARAADPKQLTYAGDGQAIRSFLTRNLHDPEDR